MCQIETLYKKGLKISSPHLLFPETLMAEEAEKAIDLMAEEAEKPIRFGNHVVKLLEKLEKIPNSAREVFLWDLIRLANAALYEFRLKRLDKRKIKYTGEDSDFVIKIEADEVNHTLSIIHKGIGLEMADLMDGIGCISPKYVKNYLGTIDKYLMDGDPNAYYSANLSTNRSLGFYSAFMVADRVKITTKEVVPSIDCIHALRNGNYPRPGDQLVLDASASDGFFRIFRDDPKPEDRLKRGTKVTLYLKNDYLTYLDGSKLRELVDKCTFDVCPYPIHVSAAADDHEREKMRRQEKDLESLKKDFEVLRELCVQALKLTQVKRVVVDDRVFDLPGHLSNDGKTFYINPRSPIMKSLLVDFNKNPQKKTKKVLVRFMNDFQLFSACPRAVHLLKSKFKLRLYPETIIDDDERISDDDDDGERIDDDESTTDDDDDDESTDDDDDDEDESTDDDDESTGDDGESIDDVKGSIDDDDDESMVDDVASGRPC